MKQYDVDVWLDMDGVLANFDAGARLALGTENTYKFEFIHGTKAFWDGLNSIGNFFALLDPMPDMDILIEALKGKRIGVLTALPSSDALSVESQKREWVADYLGLEVPVVCCLTKDKPDYCTPGSVLIDDRAVNRDMWIGNGGRFIVHENARSTIYQLKNMWVIS